MKNEHLNNPKFIKLVQLIESELAHKISDDEIFALAESILEALKD